MMSSGSLFIFYLIASYRHANDNALLTVLDRALQNEEKNFMQWSKNTEKPNILECPQRTAFTNVPDLLLDIQSPMPVK